tara:strand:+ start:735 stop:1325 length:591 start_codon:yes stop_codon:yes gene_type:complete
MTTPTPEESMKKINEIISGYNKDIDNEKTRLVNVNTRLKGVANAIGTFATSGGAAVEEINKQIEKVTQEAEQKKGKAANDVKVALEKIDFTDLKKTIGMIGAVSVEIKAAVASEGEVSEIKTDINALLPFIKSIEGMDPVKAEALFPNIVIKKLGGGDETKGKSEFKALYDAVKQATALGGKKKRQTKKRRKAHRK